MFDLRDINDLAIFYARGVGDIQLWRKPRGMKFLFLLALAGGSGGGGGFSGSSGTGRGGGGGGGAGGYTTLFMPAIMVPEILYIQVGVGGAGGAPGADSSVGGNQATFVMVAPSTSPSGTCIAKPIWGGVGKAGTGAAGGASSSGGTTNQSGATWASQFTFLTVNSGGGQSGGFNADGTAISNAILTVPSGGAGGGGPQSADRAGGAVGLNNAATILGFTQIPGAVAGSNNGSPGLKVLSPCFMVTGGSGGSGSNNGVGGNGGDGGWGCGGGGGGGGTTGGSGGKGGDGLVLLGIL